MNVTAVVRLIQCILIIWRIQAMGKQVMNVAKGIGMGVLAGTAVAAVSAKVLSGGRKKSSSMRKTAGKAMHTMSNLMGDMEKLLR